VRGDQSGAQYSVGVDNVVFSKLHVYLATNTMFQGSRGAAEAKQV